MNKAIVSGATGFVGSAVIRELLHNDIHVLALGRRNSHDIELKRLPISERLNYLQIEMSEILSLPEKVRQIDWDSDDSCVFYNFAWGGLSRLTDGTLEDQMKNVTFSANAVVAARKLGCTKFVNCGTIEETFAEQYLKSLWSKTDYHSSQSVYAVSKLASRDMCKIVAYLNKIDYVHTRFSGSVDTDLHGEGYITSTLMNILNGANYNFPSNDQLFDLVMLEDLAHAFYLVGQFGKNKADYYIGTGEPAPLSQYFSRFRNITLGKENEYAEYASPMGRILDPEAFNITDLFLDTGFVPTISFDEFTKKIAKP